MIILIAGPTCSGKSELAIRVAQNINAEIINGDAFQVYQELDIGTAKPTKKEREIVPHHLFDFVSPNKEYNVKDYQSDARNVIKKLQSEHKNIIIVGGTGLYQKATLYDFNFADEDNKVDMSDLDDLSNEELYEVLKKLDFEATKTIHMNNRKRVLRAIEIYRAHGVTKSSIIQSQNHKPIYEDIVFVGLDAERASLYDAINKRVDKMMECGLLEEVKNLKDKYDTTKHAFQAIGYKELLSYLNGEISLESAIELIKKNSRNYAKRQMTYFKHQMPVVWFNDKNEAYAYILGKVKQHDTNV